MAQGPKASSPPLIIKQHHTFRWSPRLSGMAPDSPSQYLVQQALSQLCRTDWSHSNACPTAPYPVFHLRSLDLLCPPDLGQLRAAQLCPLSVIWGHNILQGGLLSSYSVCSRGLSAFLQASAYAAELCLKLCIRCI